MEFEKRHLCVEQIKGTCAYRMPGAEPMACNDPPWLWPMGRPHGPWPAPNASEPMTWVHRRASIPRLARASCLAPAPWHAPIPHALGRQDPRRSHGLGHPMTRPGRMPLAHASCLAPTPCPAPTPYGSGRPHGPFGAGPIARAGSHITFADPMARAGPHDLPRSHVLRTPRAWRRQMDHRLRRLHIVCAHPAA